MNTHRLYVVALGAVVAALAAVGSAGGGETGAVAPSQVSGSISVIGEATGSEISAARDGLQGLQPAVSGRRGEVHLGCAEPANSARNSGPGRQPA